MRATARNHPAGTSPRFSESFRGKNLPSGYLYYSFEFEAKEITLTNSGRRGVGGRAWRQDRREPDHEREEEQGGRGKDRIPFA